MYKAFIKRFLDFLFALVILIVFGWLLIIVTLILFFTNKTSGVFFLQERPGLNNRIFKIIKFKTMNDKRDSNGNLLPDEERITTIGKFIRSTSIDELPQLINVLKGDMSIIGPRPLLVKYLPLYSKEQLRRHEVRPGITGWAQCHGRNKIDWEEKFKLDVWYVDNYSFAIDLKIMWMTIIQVLKRANISHDNHATMAPFYGSQQ